MRNQIIIENTRFIFRTNLSGDPRRDNFGSDRRKCNIIIPDPVMAREMMNEGFNVKNTKPRNEEDIEGFEEEYYVSIIANYNAAFPPTIKLVIGDAVPQTLNEDSLSEIDRINDDYAVKNVNVVLNPYENPQTGRKSLYIKTMYVEQDLDADPFMNRYNY